MSRSYWIYILASRSRTLYTGVTNHLLRRLVEHREGTVPGFTSRYRICRLVHYEMYTDIRLAIAREKEIKGWRREKKIWLIEYTNPRWDDLAVVWYPNRQKLNSKGITPKSAGDATKETAKGDTRSGTQSETKADPSPPSKSGPGSV